MAPSPCLGMTTLPGRSSVWFGAASERPIGSEANPRNHVRTGRRPRADHGRASPPSPPRGRMLGPTRPQGRRRGSRALPSPTLTFEGPRVKFRVERDVLADAVAWAARSLPVRPSVPVLAGLLIDAGADGLVLSTFDYETSARVTLDRRGRRRGQGPGLRPAARRHLSQPADQAGRDVHRRREGLADLRLRAVQPPDHAGRGVPHAPGHAGRPPAPCRSDLFAHAVAQAVTAAGRDDMLPVLTGVRLEIDGLHDRPAGHRPVPALAPRAATGTPAAPTSRGRPGAGQGARRHRQVADRRRRGDHRARRRRRRRGHHRLRGRRRPAAPVVPPPGCSTASSPRSARCSPASTSPRARSTRPPSSSRSSGSPWSPSATPRSSWPSPTAC